MMRLYILAVLGMIGCTHKETTVPKAVTVPMPLNSKPPKAVTGFHSLSPCAMADAEAQGCPTVSQ